MKKRPSSKPSRKPARHTTDLRVVIDRAAAELASSMVHEESFFYPGVLELDRGAAPTFQSRVQTMKERILRFLRGREEELVPVARRVGERDLGDLVPRMKALFFRRIEAAALAPDSTLAFA